MKSGKTESNSLLKELKTSLRSTQDALNNAYTAFDYAGDPELTEACIFEIQALQIRQNYLVKQIKSLEACTATAVTAPDPGARRWA